MEPEPVLERLKTKIYADGADLERLLELAAEPYVKGFTTNPTLMRRAGVTDYVQFAHQVLEQITDRPISFEVFSDELDEIHAQALEIAAWGDNVYVKVPVTNTRRESTEEVVQALTSSGVKVNVTGILTVPQVETVARALRGGAPSIISVFAGRIADTGRDPIPIMVESLRVMAATPSAELIWASPRELLNIVQADQIGCHIITVTEDLLAKAKLLGKDLAEYSLDTVTQFHDDAQESGFTLEAAVRS
jgi:transaldolase